MLVGSFFKIRPYLGQAPKFIGRLRRHNDHTPKTFIALEQPSTHEPLNTTHEHSAVGVLYKGAVRCSEHCNLDLLAKQSFNLSS